MPEAQLFLVRALLSHIVLGNASCIPRTRIGCNCACTMPRSFEKASAREELLARLEAAKNNVKRLNRSVKYGRLESSEFCEQHKMPTVDHRGMSPQVELVVLHKFHSLCHPGDAFFKQLLNGFVFFFTACNSHTGIILSRRFLKVGPESCRRCSLL